MADSDLLVESGGAIASIDFNRPDEGNIITRPAIKHLSDIIRDVAAMEETRVIVLKGRGPSFCTGRDGKGENREGMTPLQIKSTMQVLLNAYEAINAAPVPVVALAHGNAIGFGGALAGGCDITLAADTARFGFNEIKRGTPPMLAMTSVLRKVPQKALTYLIYSADEISAQEAASVGLVSKVYPKASFEADSAKFLSELAGRPRMVLEAVKKYINTATGLHPSIASEFAGSMLALVRASK